jgi:hypothetical protein
MTDGAFADLNEAMEGAITFERGERHDLSITGIQLPRPPKAMSPGDIANKTNAQLLIGAVCDDALTLAPSALWPSNSICVSFIPFRNACTTL